MSNVNLVDSEDYTLSTFSEKKSVGRVPPHSLEAEQAVLGAVLIDNETLPIVVENLLSEDFYSKSHRALFQAMLDLWERSEPIDAMTLSAELKSKGQLDISGGIEYLSRLLDIVPTSANTGYYSKLVKEMSLRRQIIHEASNIVSEAFRGEGNFDAFLDSVEHRIFKVGESRTSKGFVKVGEIAKDSIKQIEERYCNQEAITGIASGFSDLDSITSGFQPSDLIIVAGRPSMGKTALALSIARYSGVEEGKGIAIFSLEMSNEQILTRLLCSEGRISNTRVRSGNLGEGDFPRLVDAASKITHADIFIDDTPAISVLEMRAKARRLHRETPLSLIIVDYLQLMRGGNRKVERREQEISEISRSLKALAKELSVPVIALSQLNRAVENRVDKRPMMSDLRESGAIEQDADIIGFVYRDEVYNPETPDKGVAELIIGKHRNGPIGTVRLAFHADYTTFENLAEEVEGYDYLGTELSLDDDEFLP